MKLSFKYVIKNVDIKEIEILKDIMWHSKKVYNILLHEIREHKRKIDTSKGLNIISSKIYKEYRESNWHSQYLHSHTLLNTITNVVSNYKSYKRLEKMYNKEDNSGLKGKPRIPRYKGKNSNIEIVFTKYAIRLVGNKLKLSISKEMKKKYQVESINFLINKGKLKKLVNIEKIKMIKIKLEEVDKIEVNIIYEREEKEKMQGTNIMAIDLGLNNIVAATNKDNNETLLISGRALKSKNKYIMEKISKLQRINMKCIKKSKKHKNTKQIKKLYEYRKNYINTYLHKVSKMVIEYAKENKCSRIVIGDLKGIKEKMNYNKEFVQIPLENLVRKIEYKGKLDGIEIEKINERYTSGVSAIDKEEISKENYNKKRRISRGIFITNKGIKINADINGSLNILRKYIKKSSPNQEIAMDKGREQRPIKKRVA